MTQVNIDKALRPTSAKNLSGYGAPNIPWSQVYAESGWEPSDVRDGALYAEFSAPSAGPPPWFVYKITPETVFALDTAEPYGATRWQF